MPPSRAPLVFAALLAAGCGLVSGLDSLQVDDGGQAPDTGGDARGDDVAIDQVVQDATPLPDTGIDGGAALSTANACSSVQGDSLSLSSSSFTIELWLQVKANNGKPEPSPILWRGGRSASEPGWTLALSNGGLTFCIADTTASTCSTPYAVNANDLLHVAVVSSVQQQNTRTVQLYVRNFSTQENTHFLRGQITSGPASWGTTTGGPFTIGGVKGNTTCTNTTNVIVDDVRVYDVAVGLLQLDPDTSTIQCNTAGLLAYFMFEEGSGTTTTDCTSKLVMTLAQGASFVATPFP
jgi:hypothetical protein